MPRKAWLPCVLVGLLAMVPYLRTIWFGFVFDDQNLIVGNAFIRQPWSFLGAFAHDFWYGSDFYGYYRPIVNATLALNGRLLGWSPAGFHLVNVLVHACNVALLFRLARRLEFPTPAATLAAALFALHPAAAWPVASIVARVDLLPVTFVLLAWLSYSTPNRRPIGTVLVGLFFLLALLSKESAVAFLIIPLFGLLASSRPALRAGALACVSSLGALFACLALRLRAAVPLGIDPLAIDPLVNPLGILPAPVRLLAALELSGRYLSYLLIPVRFADPHGYGPFSATIALSVSTNPTSPAESVHATRNGIVSGGWMPASAMAASSTSSLRVGRRSSSRAVRIRSPNRGASVSI